MLRSVGNVRFVTERCFSFEDVAVSMLSYKLFCSRRNDITSELCREMSICGWKHSILCVAMLMESFNVQ